MDLSKMSPAEVAAEAARRSARRAAGLPLEGDRIDPRSFPTDDNDAARRVVEYVDPADSWVRSTPHMRFVSLPWSLLVSDNDRTQPVVAGSKVRMVLSKRYKEAKEAARVLLMSQVGGNPPLTGRVRITASLIEPNAHRTRDLSNFAKMVHDALSGIVYLDDGQIDSLTWRRGEPCIDRPRLLVAVEEEWT